MRWSVSLIVGLVVASPPPPLPSDSPSAKGTLVEGYEPLAFVGRPAGRRLREAEAPLDVYIWHIALVRLSLSASLDLRNGTPFHFTVLARSPGGHPT